MATIAWLALPAALLLGACAQAPVLVSKATPTETSESVLIVEEMAIAFPEPKVEMDGSSAATRQSRDWLWVRGQVSETQARLGVDPLWKRCRAGAGEEYGFVHARAFAWASDEDDIRVRLGDAGGERVHRGRHAFDDDTPDFRVTVEEQALDAARARALREQMTALGIGRLPAAIDPATCHHAPMQVFESCVDGRYRMTYDACPNLRPVAPRNAFHRAIALLRDGNAPMP